MEKQEMNTRYSMYNEENKAWYKDFLAKSNLVQNIIDNAKLITDFSGNERGNVVMNLLS
jgi:pimeloyl-CoA synthetase